MINIFLVLASPSSGDKSARVVKPNKAKKKNDGIEQHVVVETGGRGTPTPPAWLPLVRSGRWSTHPSSSHVISFHLIPGPPTSSPMRGAAQDSRGPRACCPECSPSSSTTPYLAKSIDYIDFRHCSGCAMPTGPSSASRFCMNSDACSRAKNVPQIWLVCGSPS